MTSTIIVLLCGAAGLYAGDALGSSSQDDDIDLLSGQDWSHLAGAHVSAVGIGVTGLDRRIVQQDGSGGQPNSPVNLPGPRLLTHGDFRVTATLKDVGSSEGYLHLYDAAPIVYDEWRAEPPGVRIGLAAGRLRVDVWDGSSDVARTTEQFGSGLNSTTTVTMTVTDTTLRFESDGATMGTIPAQRILDSGTVLFGLDGTVGRTWTLSALEAAGVNEGTVEVEAAPPLKVDRGTGTLRATAAARRRPVQIGTALAIGPLLTDDAYRSTASAQFSMITPENDFKPQFVHPQPDTYAFAEGDVLARFARANGMSVHAHTLVWHESLPAWMRRPSTPAQVRKTMTDHVRTVASHYREDVAEWDVVNEPMSDDDEDYTNGHEGLRYERNPWFQAMGERYIDLAFETAHQADPDADLYINEYGIEEDGPRWEALLALVKRLRARSVPLDGIGFQNHEYSPEDRADPAIFRKHVRALAALGVKARISEMDVILQDGESEDLQAQEFTEKLDVCLTEPNCTAFGAWGFTDRYGSTADVGTYPLTTGNALPWDEDLRPKKAYTALLARLGS